MGSNPISTIISQKAHTTVTTTGGLFLNGMCALTKGLIFVCFLICECIYYNLFTET